MSEKRLPALLLWINCLAFAGFGLGFAAFPRELAEFFTDGAPTAPSAVIDIRATYGGMSLGLGVFFGLCAARKQWVRPGLLASLLVIAGLAAARVVGTVADGEPNAFMLLFLATEVASVGLITVALRQVGPSPKRTAGAPEAPAGSLTTRK